MRLPIPMEFGDKTFTEAEIRRPTGGVIADTKKAADNGDIYAAMATFVAGCLASLGDETDRGQLRVYARGLSFVDAEYLAIQALMAAGISDDIEGVYACPRCDNRITVEPAEDDDDGERISDLEVKYAEEPVFAEVEVDPPVKIINDTTGEELVCVETIKVGTPSLSQLSRAFKKFGMADKVRMQFSAYVDATATVNGTPVDGKWKATWGMLVFERMDVMIVNKITAGLREYGTVNTVSRVCPSCGKRWDAEVDTAGFFASGLAGS